MVSTQETLAVTALALILMLCAENILDVEPLLKNQQTSQAWLYRSIVPDSQEAYLGQLQVQGQPGKLSHWLYLMVVVKWVNNKRKEMEKSINVFLGMWALGNCERKHSTQLCAM